MKVLIIYRPDSEHARKTEEYAREISMRHDRAIELVNLNTREGAAMATLYEIMQYPAILALADDGQLLKAWQGPIFPLIDEVVYYAPDRLQAL